MYVLVTAEVQKPKRAYFGTRLLPTIKSDRQPTNDLRPHAVLEIRGNLLMTPHNAVILPVLRRPRPEDVGGLHTVKKQWANIGVHLKASDWSTNWYRLLR